MRAMKLDSKQVRAILSGIGFGLIMFALIFVLFIFQLQTFSAQERISLYNSFLSFRSSIESAMNRNVDLLEGYAAFIRLNPESRWEEVEDYLDNLLGANRFFIRNVAVLKDTTIIWNYPLAGNETSIGIDLAAVQGQREVVLQVKEEQLRIFQGPVNLVQGGRGFIVRIPIMVEGLYWGQMSIVLDADLYLEYIEDLSDEFGFDTAIFEGNDTEAFFGNDDIKKMNPLETEIDFYNARWTLAVIPVSGWDGMGFSILNRIVLSLLIAFIFSFLLTLLLLTRIKLMKEATHDNLTGLFNRNFFFEYKRILQSRMERTAIPVGFLIIDINNFKEINDKHGHRVGDQVICSIAERLQAHTRGSETAFRFGGDEFLICLPDFAPGVDSAALIQRFRTELTFTQKVHHREIEISPSIGLAVFPQDGDDIDDVLHAADLRMYANKTEQKKL
jgi:diguanylate cyclase (GGDEF)-like protein